MTPTLFDYPISAYALCYGPLALTILGFVGFALLTDAHARRTYLRDMDTRTDNELTPEDMMAKRKTNRTIDTQIPSGSRIAFRPDETPVMNQAAVPAAPAPAVTAPVAEPLSEETIGTEADMTAEEMDAADDAIPPSEPDDLTMIEGIGPKISEAFIAEGVETFAKLAALNEEQMQELLSKQDVRFSPAVESFQEQASLAAAEDWNGLEALQSRLEGGRYPTDDA